MILASVLETVLVISIILLLVLVLWIFDVTSILKSLNKQVIDYQKELEEKEAETNNLILKLIPEINKYPSENFPISTLDLELLKTDINSYFEIKKHTLLDIYNNINQLSGYHKDSKINNIIDELKQIELASDSLFEKYKTSISELTYKLSIFPNNVIGYFLKIRTK